ncbi:hypothetical protein BJ878DRAFT_519883 [Calycina marina]|uniref:Uncharacterized protein n=1 Tax=Calycina marina TaxID=1763456 RepID=A0A9P7YYI0_9HELO|nr:hypothetical protein BJ878DRAFT_519883 [Calycina marina]
MFTKTLLISTLSCLTIAVPVEQRQTNPNVFSMISTHSGDSSVHLRSIVASGQRFYIGKPTATYCPTVENLDCSTVGNTTSVAVTPNSSSGLSMNVIVPGGQSGYVTTDGQLGYTIAHSNAKPEGSVSAPFLYIPQATPNTVGNLQFNAAGFEACPCNETTGVYQIYAVGGPAFVRTDCTGINIATSNSGTTTAAWQFT